MKFIKNKMATLERVMQMKEQGISENQIMQALRQEGIPPKEIEESLSQSKIKYAVDSPPELNNSEISPKEEDYNENFSRSPFQENQGEFVPSQENSAPIQPEQNYYPEYQPQPTYQEYQPQQSFDIETINEMLEQAIEEKNESLKKQISSFTKFKEDATIELDQLNSRLQKIENTIGELQMSILRKIGEYGNDIHTISKEMRATQDTFSKIIDPLTDNIRELREITGSMSPKDHPQKSHNHPNAETKKHENPEPSTRIKRSQDGFEDFLR